MIRIVNDLDKPAAERWVSIRLAWDKHDTATVFIFANDCMEFHTPLATP